MHDNRVDRECDTMIADPKHKAKSETWPDVLGTCYMSAAPHRLETAHERQSEKPYYNTMSKF